VPFMDASVAPTLEPCTDCDRISRHSSSRPLDAIIQDCRILCVVVVVVVVSSLTTTGFNAVAPRRKRWGERGGRGE